MKEDLLKIMNYYDVHHQLKHLQGEVWELNEAVLAHWHEEYKWYPEVEKELVNHIAEEIADCYVMLEQFRLYYEIPVDKIRDYMTFKVKRQIERINNDK